MDSDAFRRPLPRRAALALLGAVALAGCSCGDGDGASRADLSGVPSHALRYFYGSDARQFGDLFFPRRPEAGERSRPAPVVIMIHGGGWSAFSRAAATAAMSADLAMHGMAVWNIEYRGVGGRGGWPNTYEDVAAAVDHLPTVAGEAPVELDLGRVAVSGVSAGGNLAAWAVSRSVLPGHAPGANPAFPVDRCVAMAGVYDMARAWAARDRYVEDLLGGPPQEVPDRYRLTSPAAHIAPGSRVAVFHGRNDDIVSVRQVDYFADAARDAGNPIAAHVFDDADHMIWGDVHGSRWAAVRRELMAQLGM